MSLGIDGARINIPTVRGVLMGLVQLNTQKFGKYLNFHISHYCVRSLYQRMKFSCQAATTTRPTSTHYIV